MSIGVGSEIAGYRLSHMIGQGGMGAVYQAERLPSGEQVVLKVLREDLVGNEELRRRFVRESRYASSLDHPHIVKVHDAGEAQGQHYIAMQYVRGTDLRAMLAREGPLSPGDAMRILGQVAEALDAAHAAGLLHRDVKPGNVLIASGEGPEPEGSSYLTDFGLSKDPARDSGALTVAGEFVGTVLYAAPEQMLGEEIDARADVYSLGCVLYECLVGEPPFTGAVATDVMRAHIEHPPPKPAKKRGEVPAGFDDVVARALAKEPADRYATCGELIEAAWAAAGAVREPAAPPLETASAATTAGSLKLEVTGGSAAGMEIEVDDELLIGRHAPGPGSLGEDIEISREHARISRPGAEYVIEDLGSRNGTFLNGRRIGGKEVLRSGDTIELGGTLLRAWLQAAPPPPEPPRGPVAPPLSLVLDFDFDSAQATVRLDDASEQVRLAYEDGRWRVAREA